jgi:hypothetical protein
MSDSGKADTRAAEKRHRHDEGPGNPEKRTRLSSNEAARGDPAIKSERSGESSSESEELVLRLSDSEPDSGAEEKRSKKKRFAFHPISGRIIWAGRFKLKVCLGST